MNSYIITTGNYKKNNEKGFALWYDNTTKTSNPKKIVVINSGGDCYSDIGGIWYNYSHNYGHVARMQAGEVYSGWWVAFMHGAIAAYMFNADFIYKEEDCFCFGNSWVGSLYEDIKKKKCKMLVGSFDHAYKIEQSLVYIARDYIMEFISNYIRLGGKESQIKNRPELKFLKLLQASEGKIQFMSLRGGRNRPIPVADDNFYLQHITQNDCSVLKQAGVLDNG